MTQGVTRKGSRAGRWTAGYAVVLHKNYLLVVWVFLTEENTVPCQLCKWHNLEMNAFISVQQAQSQQVSSFSWWVFVDAEDDFYWLMRTGGMACSCHVRKDCWYCPWIKKHVGLGWFWGSLFSLPCPPLHVPSLLPMAIQTSPLQIPFDYTLSPSHIPGSPWTPVRTHCSRSQNALLPLMAFTRLSRLSCSFSFSGIYDLNDGKNSVKEKGDNGKRSSRRKRKTKKERESHLRIHNYIIQRLSSWEMDLRFLHVTLSLPSVHSSPRWRVEMSSEWGQFPKTRCGKVLFGIHEHNKRRLLLLPYKN